MPRSLIIRGVLALMPRSTAATVQRFAPTAGTTYEWVVLTSAERFAPDISGEVRTRSSSASGADSVEEMPTRIAPRSRR